MNKDTLHDVMRILHEVGFSKMTKQEIIRFLRARGVSVNEATIKDGRTSFDAFKRMFDSLTIEIKPDDNNTETIAPGDYVRVNWENEEYSEYVEDLATTDDGVRVVLLSDGSWCTADECDRYHIQGQERAEMEQKLNELESYEFD